MPSKSEAQKGFMRMSQSSAGRAKLRASGKKPAPKSVAKDFVRADAKSKKRLPTRSKKT